MEGIKQWAFSLCAAMVASGIARMLLPSSGMEKIFQVTVSVFFLCCLLSPVVVRNPELSLQLEEYAQSDIEARAARLTGAANTQAGGAAAVSLEKIIREKLDEMGINHRDITIHISTTGQSGPEEPALSARVAVEGVDETGAEKVREELREEFDIEVEVVPLPFAEKTDGQETAEEQGEEEG